MNVPSSTKIVAVALCLAGMALSTSSSLAQSTQSSSQRILIDPSKYTGANNPPPSGYVTDDGALIAPADLGGKLPTPPAPPKDGVLRSAPPATGVDADGNRGLVSGAKID
ncbi:MAG: hypothetical protein JO255_01985 [Alphaproteobacteria bacterium]|nr:hypothetical protein [Alphaproteobacteria bacterium]